MSAVLPAHLLAVGVLVLGATLVILAARPLSTRPVVAAALGVLFALAAALVGLIAPADTVLAVVVLSVVGAVALLLVPTLELQDPAHVVEATALLLLGTAGAIALAGAGGDLLQVVIGVETLALSAVTLVALGQGDRPLEAAFKYFVLGAISLAALLYGLGLIYLGTGSFGVPTAAQVADSRLVLAGVTLVAKALAFELAVVPFHWGALDAYTAAPPALAGFVMSASKLATAYALAAVVLRAGVAASQLLVWVGVLTIVWGTFAALAQRDLRRMLAYSAVTHAGFIALSLGAGGPGAGTAVFYAAVYGGMAMLVFAALAGCGTGRLPMGRLTAEGLGAVRAAGLALGLLSLSGIPPTPGFWAKLAVLVVVWQHVGLLAALVAVAGGVFSVLYYLRPLPDLFAVVRGAAPAPWALRPAGPAIAVAALLVVATALFPGLVWALAVGVTP